MKYKILQKFKDKYTGKIYKAGAAEEFTEERAKEILKVGKLIAKIEEVKAKSKKI